MGGNMKERKRNEKQERNKEKGENVKKERQEFT